MARVFITGSADGLGVLAGKWLLEKGHDVVFHARNAARTKALPDAKWALGDVSTLAAMKTVAEQAAAYGPFDAIIHNVAVGQQEARREVTEDGIAEVFAINTLAPFVLTALLPRPKRLVFLSSGLHRGGAFDARDPEWEKGRWSGSQAYSDTKLHDVLLAFAIARLWPDVLSNAVEPGWVPTKMGGPNAPDDLAKGAVTQAWLAVSDEAEAKVSGRYFFHQTERDAAPRAHDVALQDALLTHCARVSGYPLPK